MTAAQQLTIEQRLANVGLGHKRTDNSANTGKHVVYDLKTGKVIGELTAFEAIRLLRNSEAL